MRGDKAVLVIAVTVALFVGGWFAWQRWGPESGTGEMTFPRVFQPADGRLFCAVSEETGRCSCITPEGIRPAISDEECRQRARESDTRQ